MASAWTPLANITLGSAQSSVTFSSIVGTYRDLFITMAGGGSNTGQLYFRLNGDTGSNYSFVTMEGTGSVTRSNNVTYSFASIGWGDNWWQNSGSDGYIHILDYAATDKHKTALARGNAATGSQPCVVQVAARWANTAAVTSITIANVNGGTLNAGSTFALYGVS